MRKSFRYLALLLMVGMLSIAALAQTVTITGNIKNSISKDIVPAVSVTVKGSSAGSFTDEKGNFKLVTNKKLPFTLLITSVGFEQKEIEVSDGSSFLQVEAVPTSTLGTEVVISASRVPERILESPVSIERMNLATIRNTPSTNYYDMLGSIKGVDLVASSLTFKTVSTRGFNGSGNARLNQLVDGMDNQAPGLNFSVGSVIGLTELDVDNMELLPGASSALYGSGGMNGTLLINSKNPFKYQGFSVQIKQGIMHTDKSQRTSAAPFYDWSFRWGKVITPKFAIKLGAQFVHAKDWVANDESNYLSGDASLSQFGGVKGGNRFTDPNYNGVNVYGDETSADLRNLAGNNVFGLVASGVKAQIASLFGAAPPLVTLGNNFVDSVTNSYNGKPLFVSRTGYRESDIVNNNTVNVRLTGGLYYKLTDNVEASLVAYFGTGSTVYTGSDRYSLRDFKMGQYKIEFKGKQWSLRAYTTQENSGDTYNATVTTQLFNEDWKASSAWYPQYTTTFLTTKVTPYLTYLGGIAAGAINPATTPFTGYIDDYTAHNRSRDTADKGRPLPGTALFNQTFDKVRKKPIPAGGLFLDRSDLWQADGTYNFSDKIKFVDILVGGNFKQYRLNSQGTIFADYDGPISINEYGGFVQLGKKLFDEKLKLTASGRYDKNQNFAGRFTPRVTAVVTVAKTHNVRFSYQTAYRFPTTQNQWINLLVGGGVRLLGGLPELRELYKFNTNPAYTLESFRAAVASLQSGNPPTTALALLKVADLPEYKAESLQSYEVGYKGLFMKSLLVDAYVYFGTYNNFLGRTNVVQSTNGTPAGLLTARNTYSIATNTSATVKTSGYGISLNWVLPKNFALNANVTQDKISDVPVGFVSFFNVPTYRLVLGVANSGFGPAKRLGFSVSMRNQDGYFYESDFRQGQLDGFTTIDGQVSYKLPSSRSVIKLGATNLTNKYYQTGFGNPSIGGVYYVSFGYNVF
jgi:outer membrane receptor protein involved in Fe transport